MYVEKYDFILTGRNPKIEGKYLCHTQTKPLIFDAIAHASSMRHRCCPFSSTALHLRRRRSRFIY